MELIRHILACNNAQLPGDRWPVWLDGEHVGWVRHAIAEQAAELGAGLDESGLTLRREQVAPLTSALAARRLFRWRDEAFDLRADPDGPALAQIDRGALPLFGLGAIGVHLNGLVGDRLWVARRSRGKPLDPGKLDHLVAGGVAAGDTVTSTVLKEAAEEACLPPALAANARAVGRIRYAMERAEGLRRDTLFCFDLELPAGFEPRAADGEVEAFELWPLERVLETVRRSDDFKFNVNLVLIDLFIRRGLVSGAEAASLTAALASGPR
ncbi:MAG: NUDIX domain-containing protein [Acetobacteraceae bacterium]|nr:NUDIX domain-containing protein [Acetobacteraceae bacterium]